MLDDDEPGYLREPSKRIAEQQQRRNAEGLTKDKANAHADASSRCSESIHRPYLEGFNDKDWDELERLVTSILKWNVTGADLVAKATSEKLATANSELRGVIKALKSISKTLDGRRRPGLYGNSKC